MPAAPRGCRARPRPSAPMILLVALPRRCGTPTRSAATMTVGLSVLGQGLAQQIEPALGGKARADEHFVRQLARLRSAEELAAAQKAAWIAERGYEQMLKRIPRPARVRARGRLYCVMKELGAEDNFLLAERVAAQSRGARRGRARARRRRHHPVRDHALLSGPVCAALPHHRHRRAVADPARKYALLQEGHARRPEGGGAGRDRRRGVREDGRLLPRGGLRRLLPATLYARARPRPRHHVGPARRSDRSRARALDGRPG